MLVHVSVLTLLPSSQVSTPVLTKPSPHLAATQVLVQASVLIALPSSQASVPCTTPSPHTAITPSAIKGFLPVSLRTSIPSEVPSESVSARFGFVPLVLSSAFGKPSLSESGALHKQREIEVRPVLGSVSTL